MSATPDGARLSVPAAAEAAGVDATPELRRAEREAARRQRIAERLQAAYLIVVLAAPAARLVPLPGGRGGRVDDAASALLLLAAVGMRVVLRAVAADADWVRARRESEQVRAAAWRTAMAQPADAGDRPVAERWRFYRRHRIDDQIAYFELRAARHRRLARRWRLIRLVLTIVVVVVALGSLVVPVPGAAIGLLSALLASSEAWLQFRRSDALAASYAEAHDELGELATRDPADEAALAAAVEAVELALERERWTWTAIVSVTVLASSGRRPTTPVDRVAG